MYVSKVEIKDFRGLHRLVWELADEDPRPGWHVIIGDNGSGKSSVLRAVALGLLGPWRAPALRINWNDWVRFGRGHAEIDLTLEETIRVRQLRLDVVRHPSPSVVPRDPRDEVTDSLIASIWREAHALFASYGPFRRFTGGDRDSEKLLEADPALARHLSLFSESVALTAGLAWLRRGQARSAYERTRRPAQKRATARKKKGKKGGKTAKRRSAGWVGAVVDFLNGSGLLPQGVHVDEVTPDDVVFRDGSKARVPAECLSDGQRSVLSMTLELLRQFFLQFHDDVFGDDGTTVCRPGVVLIDEVDAHLHPTWQQSIGPWFVKAFPQVQFLVTTHSPLVCQAALNGTVFRLPAPGARDEAKFLRGVERDRLIFGNAAEAYGTGAFGLTTTRSDEGEARAAELAALNVKSLHTKLTKSERTRLERLQSVLPTVGVRK